MGILTMVIEAAADLRSALETATAADSAIAISIVDSVDIVTGIVVSVMVVTAVVVTAVDSHGQSTLLSILVLSTRQLIVAVDSTAVAVDSTEAVVVVAAEEFPLVGSIESWAVLAKYSVFS